MTTTTRTSLAELLALLPDAALLVDGADQIVAANQRAAEMFGAQQTDALNGPTARLLSLGEATPEARRTHGQRLNDVPFALDLSVATHDTEDGRYQLCILRELAPAALLDEARRHLDAAFEDSPVGMALCNTDGEYIRLNDAMCILLGRTRGQLIGHRDQEFTHPDDRGADVSVAWDILAGDYHTHQCEKRFVRPDGSVVWALANLTFVRDEAGLPLNWVGQFQDITERRHAEARLRELAEQDPLTELLNRRAFTDAVEQHLGRARRYGASGAVLMIDLDGFKHLNDTRGHTAGDECLVQCARALEQRLRSSDALARIGGDEFAALLPVAEQEQAETVASALADAVREHTDGATASVGVAMIEPSSAGTNELLTRADRALYAVKRRGGDGHEVYA